MSNAVIEAVRRIMALRDLLPVADLRLDTNLLNVDCPSDGDAQALLEQMAKTGQGSFHCFSSAGQVDFKDIDARPLSEESLLTMALVTNLNVLPVEDGLTPADRDQDGLSDVLETELGASPDRADSDGDGYCDSLEFRESGLGFDPLDPADASCALESDRQDRDGDGLLECEERLVGTDPQRYDTDGDGLPDGLELRAGTSPLADDSWADPDLDGLGDQEEVRLHLDPRVEDADQASASAYRYRIVQAPADPGSCYQMEVENIGVVDTGHRGSESGWGSNDILVVIQKTPQDASPKEASERVACARVRCLGNGFGCLELHPSSGIVRLSQGDFKKPAATRCVTDAECPADLTCEPALETCVGPPCEEDTDCDSERGFTCAPAPAGRSYPLAGRRCTDWFDADRDCRRSD